MSGPKIYVIIFKKWSLNHDKTQFFESFHPSRDPKIF